VTLYILGLALFFGIHLIILARPLRDGLMAKLGENGWKMVVTVISFAGILFIVLGYSETPADQLWDAQTWGRPALFSLMPFVFILLAASNMKGHIRRITRHPMSIAIVVWATCHLAANGDIGSTLLFGSFLVYTPIAAIAAEMQGRVKRPENPAIRQDIIAIVAGIVMYAVIMHLHEWLFGVAIVG
jgi:uncharacterized membrane protein